MPILTGNEKKKKEVLIWGAATIFFTTKVETSKNQYGKHPPLKNYNEGTFEIQ